MEIERKFLISRLPADLAAYPVRQIEQGYLCTSPVVRIRRDNERYELTYKSGGLMAREEYNLPLSAAAYEHLKAKIDGRLIRKKRYMIPLEPALMIELDVFLGDLVPLVIAEVEFASETEAREFVPPAWFGSDVTFDGRYHNSCLSRTDQSPR